MILTKEFIEKKISLISDNIDLLIQEKEEWELLLSNILEEEETEVDEIE